MISQEFELQWLQTIQSNSELLKNKLLTVVDRCKKKKFDFLVLIPSINVSFADLKSGYIHKNNERGTKKLE